MVLPKPRSSSRRTEGFRKPLPDVTHLEIKIASLEAPEASDVAFGSLESADTSSWRTNITPVTQGRETVKSDGTFWN